MGADGSWDMRSLRSRAICSKTVDRIEVKIIWGESQQKYLRFDVFLIGVGEKMAELREFVCGFLFLFSQPTARVGVARAALSSPTHTH